MSNFLYNKATISPQRGGVETIINWISQSFLNGNDMEIIMNKGDEMYDIVMAAEERTDNKGNAGQD